MAKFNDIMIKQNASSYRGLVGDVTSSMRSLTSADVGRLPAGAELTLELEDNPTAGLLLPAVQKVREAAARASTVEIKLNQSDSVFIKGFPSTVTQKVLGSGRQGFSIKLRKA